MNEVEYSLNGGRRPMDEKESAVTVSHVWFKDDPIGSVAVTLLTNKTKYLSTKKGMLRRIVL